MSLVVVKLGGGVAAEATSLVSRMAREHSVCVVHGAGPQISAEMERLGLDVKFVGGRRVTTAAGLAVVRASFASVNREICAALGPRSVPLFGDVIGLQASPVPELGLVGEAVPSRPRAVAAALDAGLIPVVAPLAEGPLNVNADEAAAALAIGVGADRILFLTDVPGLLLGGAVAATVRGVEAERMLEAGELTGGIVPKLRAAIDAARGGVDAKIGATAVLA
ncbi:MAG TPA: acetylglutamate kinase [Gaiellaceae bacterium]|nr:acetylglutamate kinase [Gaiellaceae bacterium]